MNIEQTHAIEIEKFPDGSPDSAKFGSQGESKNHDSMDSNQLDLQDGKIQLPDWANNVTSVLWIPVRATSETLARGTQAG